ncbi:MAG TPA: hypothetical protein VF244_08185 [Acidimicrobiales bacterium]
MIGRRLPVVDAKTFTTPQKPGDYSGPVDIGDGKQAVYFLLPIARDEGVDPGARSIHAVHSPPHTLRECADGSLEIRASIGARGTRNEGYVWHGYLDEGHVWREC